jgi:hypothetical protein
MDICEILTYYWQFCIRKKWTTQNLALAKPQKVAKKIFFGKPCDCECVKYGLFLAESDRQVGSK